MPTFDTRFFVEFFGQKDPEKKKQLIHLASQGGRCSTITLHELYKLFSEIEGKEVAELRFNILRSTYEIAPVSSSIARDSALLRLQQNIPVADSIIAATALEKDRVVITDDPHFSQLPKIKAKWIR